MKNETFIFCLEAVPDVELVTTTNVLQNLGQLAKEIGITSIHKTCDNIEDLVESLNTLLHNDHNFTDYEIIYLVMPGKKNNICLNDYYYSFQEIAELFEGKMKGKMIHFSNTKIVDLTSDEAQYFLDITGAMPYQVMELKTTELTVVAHSTKPFLVCAKSLTMSWILLKPCIKSIMHFVNCLILDYIINL